MVTVEAGPPCALELAEPRALGPTVVVNRSAVLAAPLVLRLLDAHGNACRAGRCPLGQGPSPAAPGSVMLTLRRATPQGPQGPVAQATGAVAGVRVSEAPGESFCPDGSVALAAAVGAEGTVRFERVQLLAPATAAEAAYRASGGAWWAAGRYVLRAELRSAAGAGAELCGSAKPASAVALEMEIEVLPEASERDTADLERRSSLLQRKARLQATLVRLQVVTSWFVGCGLFIPLRFSMCVCV